MEMMKKMKNGSKRHLDNTSDVKEQRVANQTGSKIGDHETVLLAKCSLFHSIDQDKKVDLAKRQTSKSVYSCLVVGPRDAGKTTFCQVGGWMD